MFYSICMHVGEHRPCAVFVRTIPLFDNHFGGESQLNIVTDIRFESP